jgi:hypothetical protein
MQRSACSSRCPVAHLQWCFKFVAACVQRLPWQALITLSAVVPNCNCGGKAYLGVFDDVDTSYGKPAMVFYDMLGGGFEKYVAEAISHEVSCRPTQAL